MILADTSVLIDFFKGLSNESVDRFKEILLKDIPFGITSHIYQEILQGAKNDKEFRTLKDYLETQRFYFPLDQADSFAQAAKIYFNCRKKGITIRSTIDCLIAQIAIENDLFLLHNDEDYIRIATVVQLKIY